MGRSEDRFLFHLVYLNLTFVDNNDSELRGNFVRIARSIGTQATFIICRIELICLFCLFHVTVLFVSLVHVVLFEYFFT